jgi:hypothetical protein
MRGGELVAGKKGVNPFAKGGAGAGKEDPKMKGKGKGGKGGSKGGKC